MNQTKKRKITALKEKAATYLSAGQHELAAHELKKANAIARKPT